MKKDLNFYLIILAILAIIFYVYLGVEKIGDSLCGNSDYTYLSSPDGTHKASSYIRSCGATTGYATSIEIGNSNVFIAEGYYKEETKMKWIDNNTFIIEYSGKKENLVFYDKMYKDINIKLIQK